MKVTVKQARLLKGVTQEKMAELLGIGYNTYRKIENSPDSATVELAKKISSITGFCFEDIFFAE